MEAESKNIILGEFLQNSRKIKPGQLKLKILYIVVHILLNNKKFARNRDEMPLNTATHRNSMKNHLQKSVLVQSV